MDRADGWGRGWLIMPRRGWRGVVEPSSYPGRSPFKTDRNRDAPDRLLAGHPNRPNLAGMDVRLIRTTAAAALLAALGTTGPAAAAQSAAGTAGTAAAVDVPARSSTGAAVGPEITVATHAFPGGPRFVTATVSARHTPGSSGRATMLSVELTCGADSVQATTNVLITAVLTPRRVMRDATTCTVTARAAVDRPTAGDGLRVTATLSASSIVSGAAGYVPTGFPVLLRPGARADVTPVAYEPPAGARSVEVTGDLKVTTCTSVGGSRENGSPYLCAASRVKPGGSTLVVALVAQQKAAAGGYCAVQTLSTRTVRVGKAQHHAMVAKRGTFTLSTAVGCTRTVRVKLAIRVLAGADVVAHRRGTITSVFR